MRAAVIAGLLTGALFPSLARADIFPSVSAGKARSGERIRVTLRPRAGEIYLLRYELCGSTSPESCVPFGPKREFSYRDLEIWRKLFYVFGPRDGAALNDCYLLGRTTENRKLGRPAFPFAYPLRREHLWASDWESFKRQFQSTLTRIDGLIRERDARERALAERLRKERTDAARQRSEAALQAELARPVVSLEQIAVLRAKIKAATERLRQADDRAFAELKELCGSFTDLSREAQQGFFEFTFPARLVIWDWAKKRAGAYARWEFNLRTGVTLPPPALDGDPLTWMPLRFPEASQTLTPILAKLLHEFPEGLASNPPKRGEFESVPINWAINDLVQGMVRSPDGEAHLVPDSFWSGSYPGDGAELASALKFVQRAYVEARQSAQTSFEEARRILVPKVAGIELELVPAMHFEHRVAKAIALATIEDALFSSLVKLKERAVHAREKQLSLRRRLGR